MNKIADIRSNNTDLNRRAVRRIFRKSTNCSALRSAVLSRRKSSRTGSPGKNKVSCRAKSSAAWAAWDFSVSAIRNVTADPTWTRSARRALRRTGPLDVQRRCDDGAGSFRDGFDPSVPRQQRSAEGQVDAADHRGRGHHRRCRDRTEPALMSRRSAPSHAARATVTS